MALLSGLRIWCCCELQHRLQMRLRSSVAVAVVEASSCSSNLNPSLGTSTYRGCATEKDTHTYTGAWRLPRLS